MSEQLGQAGRHTGAGSRIAWYSNQDRKVTGGDDHACRRQLLWTGNAVMRSAMPKILTSSAMPARWRGTRRFLPVGLQLKLLAKRGVSHWQGGPTTHNGAKCPLCQRPLTLIWDLSLEDPTLPDFIRAVFGPCTRLPLYYCMTCPPGCRYAVVSDTKIKCFRPRVSPNYDPDNDPSEENPFRTAPQELPRRRISFQPLSTSIDGILGLEEELGFDCLDADARKRLAQFYGKRVESWDLPFSQLGGRPLFTQGHREIVCPNSLCPASKLVHPFSSWQRDFLMKELAVVEGDSGPEVRGACAQIAYHICCVCLAIHADYRCS